MPLFGRRRYWGIVGPKDDGKGGGFATKVINFAGSAVIGAATAGAGTAVLAAAGAATCSVGAAAATGAVTSAAASIANKEPTVQASATGKFGGGARHGNGDATHGKHEEGGTHHQDTADARAPEHPVLPEPHHQDRADARVPEHPVLPQPAGIETREVQPTRLENTEPTMAEIEAAFAELPPMPHQLCQALPQLRKRAADERKKAEVATFVRDEVWGPNFEQDAAGMIMGPPDPGELVFDALLGMAGNIFLTQRAQKATKEAEDLSGWVRKLETEGNCGPEPSQSSSSSSGSAGSKL